MDMKQHILTSNDILSIWGSPIELERRSLQLSEDVVPLRSRVLNSSKSAEPVYETLPR